MKEIILQLDDEDFAVLANMAKESGASVEGICHEWVRIGVMAVAMGRTRGLTGMQEIELPGATRAEAMMHVVDALLKPGG